MFKWPVIENGQVAPSDIFSVLCFITSLVGLWTFIKNLKNRAHLSICHMKFGF